MSDITANVVVSMPNQLFTLARSFKAASGGKIYIGQIDTDPVNPANQIQVYLENEDGSHVPVAQPLIINAAGYPVYNGQIAKFVTVQGHSMAVYDMYGTQQFYYPNILKYDPDQFRQFLATSAGAAAIGALPSGTVQDFINQQNKKVTWVTPQSQGAPCNGVDDDTAVFTTMVQNYRNIEVPAGNYVLDINKINVPSNTTIRFNQYAVVKLKTQKVSGGSGINYWLFKLAGTASSPVTNVNITGGRFLGGDDSIVCIAIGSYVNDVRLRDTYCENMRYFIARDGDGTYANSTSSTRPKNIRINNINGTLSVTPVTTNAFIQFNYAEMFSVTDCYSYGYWFGGMCWGGDSNPSVNGDPTNFRKCRTGRFENCYFYVKQAGIWGSMCYDLDIKSCYTEAITPLSSDVGFDLEGCHQSNVISCSVKDFLNGNLATFFYCRQVNFTQNKSWITDVNCRHARFNNSGQNSGAREILVSQNEFYSEGVVAAISQNGAAQNLVIENNTLMNTVISLIANNNGVIKILNNKLHYSLSPTQTFNAYGYYAAVAIGAHHGFDNGACGAYVENNTFSTDVAWDATNSVAIFIVHTSGSRSTYTSIRGGGVLTTGWKYDFGLINTGTAANIGPRYAVEDFRISSGSYFTTPNGSSRYPEGIVNARDQFGRPWPTAQVDGAYMFVGQTFPLLTPTATKRGTYVYVSGVGPAATVADYQ